MDWPPLRDEVKVVTEYTSLLDACRDINWGGDMERVVILAKNVDELGKVEDLPRECIILIKPDGNNVNVDDS